jgi:shikimate dehydrogenase
MKIFGLIGYPLGHSFSEKYFNGKFLSEELENYHYYTFALKQIDLLPDLIKDNPGLCGLNVTIPYKVEVLRYLDDIDGEAMAIGAVNVIKIIRCQGSVRLKGYNTDAPAFRETLEKLHGSEVKKALVLGTGGASASVCHVLEQMGITVSMVSRNTQKGDITYNNITVSVLQSADLIVNTTPLGMYPATDDCPPIDYKELLPRQILYDLIYNPEKTEFLLRGEKQGCTIINGLEMLHLQAELAWKIWNQE